MRPYRQTILDLEPHGIAEVARLGLGQPDVIPLWFGEGDMVTPAFIRDAAKKALDDGRTFYDFSSGTVALRRAIQTYEQRLHGRDIAIERIAVPGAAMLSIVIALECVLEQGDNVVCISPVWPNIFFAVRTLGGVDRHVRLDLAPEGWTLDLDRLFAACDDRTKAIFIASPGNPTGWMMPRGQQEAVLAFARDRGIAIIADEVYNRIVYEGDAAPSFLDIAGPDDPVFVINSFSKAWAMTGWRLGWMVAPAILGESLIKLAGFNNTGATVFAQYGGVAALDHGEPVVAEMRERCRKGREIVLDRLAGHNRITLPPIAGAFYAFPHIDGVTDSLAFCKSLLATARVGLAPGSAFGPGFESHVRICYAQDPERLSIALDRLVAALD